MDVVNSAADLQRVRVNLVEYSGKVIMGPRGNVGVKHGARSFVLKTR